MSGHKSDLQSARDIWVPDVILNSELKDGILVVEAIQCHFVDFVKPKLHQMVIEERLRIPSPFECVQAHVQSSIGDVVSKDAVSIHE